MEIDRHLLAADHGQGYDYDEFADLEIKPWEEA